MAKHTFCFPENCVLSESENERDNQEISKLVELSGAENLLKTIQEEMIHETIEDITLLFSTSQ